MGNYKKCKVVKIRDMSVVTNMGHTLVLRIVMHVLELRLNLMSLGSWIIEGLLYALLMVCGSYSKDLLL